MRADLLHLIFRRARVEGEHLIWPSGNYSIQYNRKVYNIKAVLRGEEEMGLRYKNTCGVSRCVFSGHNEPHERTKTKNFRNCAFCGRAIRPWGVLKKDAPDTVASAGELCASCYKSGYSPLREGYEIAGLTDDEQATVRRTVPEDLWSYFGVS